MKVVSLMTDNNETALQESTVTSPSHIFFNATLPTREPYVRPFEDFAITLSGVIIFFLCAVGLILNLLTILVIQKYRKIRNVFLYLICSLCISDLISALISPLFWYRRTLGFDDWNIPNFFCKFYWATDITTTFATALHIMSFGFMRYVSIKYPFFFYRVTIKGGIYLIVTIWIVSIASGFVPFYIFCGARERDRFSNYLGARWPSCTVNTEWYEEYKRFQQIAYPIFLFLPFISVIVISILISVAVRSSSNTAAAKSANERAATKRKQNDRQIVLQLMLIVLSFLIGYIPFTVYEFWAVQNHPNTEYHRSLDYWLGLSEYFFIRFSECLNPILYNLGSSKMRKYTAKYIEENIKCTKEQSRKQRRSALTNIGGDDRPRRLPVV